MPEELKYKGVWWLPDQPEKQISGQLTLTVNNKATLELHGALVDLNWDLQFNPPLILGLSQSGRQVTLHKCYVTNRSSHPFTELSTVQLDAQMVFIGVHFPKEENIRFKGLSIRYSHLEEWLDRHDFHVHAVRALYLGGLSDQEIAARSARLRPNREGGRSANLSFPLERTWFAQETPGPVGGR